ncbi:hypothetical protein LV457_10165 [Mycobacterium sp. MYCO198283]|uniref:hypothetical protein n=1 Tax=Mycobacterium sp. MYCO198283 TaxID=2883505 RepID=UPI001E44A57B|nr:hypothetical protein [Mycobacterium sp. MYCO198283]MCG5432651.1 hypothetical protein [Mycobacterium sp. MYCO198283]
MARWAALLGVIGGLITAPLLMAGGATAAPCNDAYCVPFVDRNITPRGTCPFSLAYDFGLDAAGNTYMCNPTQFWVPTAPLIGERRFGEPCRVGERGLAQAPDGNPLECNGTSWQLSTVALFTPTE